MNLAKTLVLLFVLPIAARRVKTAAKKLVANTLDPVIPSAECAPGISEPSAGNSVQSHFDSKRKAWGFSHEGNDDLERAKTCTKRDVCLLMRQLDMDFYKRARAGKLTDADTDIPPEVSWLNQGSCRDHARGEGKRYAPIMDKEACAAQLKKSGVKGFTRISRKVKTVSSDEYPAGCSIVVNNRKRKGNKGFITVRLNTNSNSTQNAGRVTEKGKSFHSWGTDTSTKVLCEHDRTLSPSSASYYSPYKLKQSMVLRGKMSTTCSFGMYAHLARKQETKSSCANILTHRTSSKYYSAQDALDKAKALEDQGKTQEAADVRKYVEMVRQKYVLIDLIANDWCPGVWTEALATDANTCLVPRVTDPSAEDAKTLQKLSDHPRASKIVFQDDFCKGVTDDNLADRLGGVSEAPPDFFRDATVGA